MTRKKKKRPIEPRISSLLNQLKCGLDTTDVMKRLRALRKSDPERYMKLLNLLTQ